MESTYLFSIVSQVLKVLLICKIQPPDLLFICVFISFYISRYYFSETSRLYSKISEKIFSPQIFLFNRFTQTTPTPLNGQNLLSVTKVYCQWCSLILPNTFGHLTETAWPTQFRVDVLSHCDTIPILFCLRF